MLQIAEPTAQSRVGISSLPAPRIVSGGYTVPAERCGWLRPSSIETPLADLAERMSRDGYLYLPNFLDRDEVLAARRSVCEHLASEGRLDPSRPTDEAMPRAGTKLYFKPEYAAHNPIVEKPLYTGAMMSFFTRFLGGPVRHYDFTWLRVVSPGKGSRSHCDVVYMGRGTHNLYTAWTPLGDVSLEVGGLMVLEGTNNNDRLKNTYGKADVDSYCENRPGKRDGWSKGTGGALTENPMQVQDSLGNGARWLTTNFSAGDVVLFSVFTVHGSLDNQTKRIRISTDTRYQLASDPVDERWIGENPIGHGAAGKRGRIC